MGELGRMPLSKYKNFTIHLPRVNKSKKNCSDITVEITLQCTTFGNEIRKTLGRLNKISCIPLFGFLSYLTTPYHLYTLYSFVVIYGL